MHQNSNYIDGHHETHTNQSENNENYENQLKSTWLMKIININNNQNTNYENNNEN